MKKPTKKLSLTTQTIRNLQSDELSRVVGGSVISGTSVISVSSGTSVISIGGGTSVISRNPSGGIVGH
jgi:hypothetical protein